MSEQDQEEKKFETVTDWESAELSAERVKSEKANARYIDAKSESATLNGTLRAEIVKLEGQLAAANSACTRASETIAELREKVAEASKPREHELVFNRGPSGLILSPVKVRAV